MLRGGYGAVEKSAHAETFHDFYRRNVFKKEPDAETSLENRFRVKKRFRVGVN